MNNTPIECHKSDNTYMTEHWNTVSIIMNLSGKI